MKTFLSIILYIAFHSSLPCLETVGSPFTVSLFFRVPEESLGALETYLDSIKALRPLPGDYLLESYSIDQKKGLLTVTGRFMREGVHTLTLGTFEWGADVIVLPQVEVTVAPSREKPLSAQDMLLPFPEVALKETKPNFLLKRSLFEAYAGANEVLLQRYRNVRKGVVGGIFLLVITPFLFLFAERKIQVWRAAALVISPEKELALVKKSYDWTKLLALLQKVSGKESELTSYELEEYFTQKGSPCLAKAAHLIERYGYVQKNYPERFEEAVILSEKSLA